MAKKSKKKKSQQIVGIVDIKQWRSEKKEAKKQWRRDMNKHRQDQAAVTTGVQEARVGRHPKQGNEFTQPQAVEADKGKTKRKKVVTQSKDVGAERPPDTKKLKTGKQFTEVNRVAAQEPPEIEIKGRAQRDSNEGHNTKQGPVLADPEAFKIVVAGFPYHTDEDTLWRDFSECGEVASLRLLKDRVTGKSRGIAFIGFTSKIALDAALKYNGSDYGGRSLVVQKAHKAVGKIKGESKNTNGNVCGKSPSTDLGDKPKGCTSVIVKGLAYSVTDTDLIQMFQSCGDGATNVKILRDRETGDSRGMAFVDFDSDSAVDDAIKLNGAVLKGRAFTMDYAKPRLAPGKYEGAAKSKGPMAKPEGCTSVVIKGLAYMVTEADLRNTFASCGAGPKNVRIAVDKLTGMSRGIAFVEFDAGKGVDEAIKLHGTELKGRRFIMEYAKPHEKQAKVESDDKIRGPRRKPAGCTSVVVKGLAKSVTEALLMQTFKSCGEGPRNARIVVDEYKGVPTGTAFVNFASEAAVDAAMKLDGAELNGRPFTMGYVKPREKQ